MTIEYQALIISRQLRKNQTPAEKVFWAAVRRKQFENQKFLRQHPVFYKYHGRDRFFIADFYCRELQLIVEIDGGIHEQQKDYDEIMSEILETQKELRIIRFENREVLETIDKVMAKLKEFITHPPSPFL